MTMRIREIECYFKREFEWKFFHYPELLNGRPRSQAVLRRQ